jgi:putative transposase
MGAEQHSPTNLTDVPWALLTSLLPMRPWQPGGPGRPPVDVRRVIDGILSRNKTGCQWHMIPPRCVNWSTIYGYCKRWRRAGLWARLMEALRQLERHGSGRKPEPAAGSADSQMRKIWVDGA